MNLTEQRAVSTTAVCPESPRPSGHPPAAPGPLAISVALPSWNAPQLQSHVCSLRHCPLRRSRFRHSRPLLAPFPPSGLALLLSDFLVLASQAARGTSCLGGRSLAKCTHVEIVKQCALLRGPPGCAQVAVCAATRGCGPGLSSLLDVFEPRTSLQAPALGFGSTLWGFLS